MKPNKDVVLAQRLIELGNQLQAIISELKVLVNAPEKVRRITDKEVKSAIRINRFCKQK